MANNRKEANKNIWAMLFNFIWLILFASSALAFVNVNNIDSPKAFFDCAELKALEIRNCMVENDDIGSILSCSFKMRVNTNVANSVPQYNNENDSQNNPKENNDFFNVLGLDKIGDKRESDIGGIFSISVLNESSLEEIKDKLTNIQVVDKLNENDKYDRKDWKHWIAYGENSCWNVREEVMYRQAIPGSLILLDKDKKETDNKLEACYVKSGKWIDPWTQEEINSPSDIDIDHHIPLALAFISGGDKLSSENKSKYANDLDILVATSSKQNRSKGAKSPSEWMPPNKNTHCTYAKLYVLALDKYNFVITQADKDVLDEALSTCPAQ